MTTRITIDPITRIEGHLRIDLEVDGGKVSKAYSSGTMWRGIELIVQGRDPRDAWSFVQRICGVCTTVHAMASVRSVESALGLEIPLNAQLIRNIIISAHSPSTTTSSTSTTCPRWTGWTWSRRSRPTPRPPRPWPPASPTGRATRSRRSPP